MPGLRAGERGVRGRAAGAERGRHLGLLRANDSARLWQDPARRRSWTSVARRYRAGEPVSDLCRACKVERAHTAIAVDPEGRVLRVMCDFCGSQHNYRGGGEEPAAAAQRGLATGAAPSDATDRRKTRGRERP